MDYITFDALRHNKLDRIAFTYDIFCKWWIHLEKRALEHFPPEMTRAFLKTQWRGFVPKLHLYAHGPSCRTAWSLNYHRGVGRTDGESTERDWAAAVVAALQTAEMNPAARHAALDDHWIDRNFTRLIGLSELLIHATQHLLMHCLEDLLLKWFNEAAKWAPLQRATVTKLETGYPIATINAWKTLVAKWEEDHQNADPYEEPEFGE
jgi:hypothetical protein